MKNISKFIETSKAAWKQAKFSGVEYIPLQMDLAEKVGSMIVKMSAHSSYPKHRHPASEEIFILRGSLMVGEQTLKGGDYLFSPQGTIHAMSSAEGCVFYMHIPEGIEVISQTNFDDIEATADVTEPGPAGNA